MAARSIELTKDLDAFVDSQIETGHYADVSEVVREALRVFAEAERADEAKVVVLREAIEEGLASEIYKGDAFADVRREFGLTARR